MTPRDEVVRVFLAETHENLDRVENTLLELEKNPSNREPVAGIFRAFHCLKGTSGFLGFARLEGLAHAAEALLTAIREGKVSPSGGVVETLLSVVDALRKALLPVAREGRESDMDFRPLIDALNRPLEAKPAPAPAPSRDTSVKEAPASTPDATVRPAGKVRVDVGVLDKLMNLVGELVLARNQIQQAAQAKAHDDGLAGPLQRLSYITGELQEGVMKTRMQPVSVVWDHFPRIARDIANGCGKKVRLEMEGHDTELDRGIIEAIGDPLVHLLRNAIDHGIEAPAKRAERGKAEEGLVRIKAYHEGGQVVIQISDDGAGIQTNLLRVKALKARLITPEVAARMNDREALNLIFLRGVTTAEKVTNLSGRGVGMDIVRANIEKVGGTIEVRSRKNEGSVFLLRIPLTLAIIPALIASSGGERFALPRPAVRELVRLEGEAAKNGVERVHDALVTRLRGQLLPLVKLDALLGLALAAPAAADVLHILVVHAHGRPFGLVVDAVLDTQEIVVKPVGPRLKELGLYQGATILGDGRVALILDVVALADRGGVTAESHDLLQVARPAAPAPVAAPKNVLLLVGARDGGRLALPLGRVTRLEEFGADKIERAGGQEMIQYRGQILPLLALEAALPERRVKPRAPDAAQERPDRLQVVVHERQGRPVGLVVHRILDIVEEDLAAPRPPSRKGVKCCAVIREKVTEVLDLDELLSAVDVPGEPKR